MAALMTRMWRSLDEHEDVGSGVGPADADVVEAAAVAQGEVAVGVDEVGADAVVGVGGAVAGGGFGPGGVGGGGGLAVRQGPVRPAGVVVAGEGVEEGLELGEGGGLGAGRRAISCRVCQNRSILPWVWGWFGRPFFCASRGGAARARSRCGRRGRRRTGWCRPGRCRSGWRPGRRAASHGGAERGQHDRAGDPAVRGAGAGRSREWSSSQADDLGVGAAGQPVVGEVGLPALVRLLGGEPQVGRLRPLARLGD